MKIIKRSGAEVEFDPKKIVVAVTKANDSVVPSARMSQVQIKRIAEDVESAAANINRSLSVEEILKRVTPLKIQAVATIIPQRDLKRFLVFCTFRVKMKGLKHYLILFGKIQELTKLKNGYTNLCIHFIFLGEV